MVEVSARLHLFIFEKSRIGLCRRQPLHALHISSFSARCTAGLYPPVGFDVWALDVFVV